MKELSVESPSGSARDPDHDGSRRAMHPRARATLNFDGLTSVGAVPDLDFLDRVVTGSEPHTGTADFEAGIEPLALLPEGFRVVREHVHRLAHNSHERTLARSSSSSILVTRWDERTHADVSASDRGERDRILGDLRARGAPIVEQATNGRVPLRVSWLDQDDGPQTRRRGVDAPTWDRARCNYPPKVADGLDELVLASPPTRTARLILWHGEPGTGKTTAVLSLLEAWRSWCDGHVVMDPERFCEVPAYLTDVLAGEAREDRWRLVVAEDADEYLRADARRRSGPSLGRLLNLTDGIIGRGSRTLVLLTTNEDIGRLHPAITRPGRCAASVEFTRFSPSDAARWLETANLPSQPLSLAELYQLRDATGGPGVGPASPAPVGTYL